VRELDADSSGSIALDDDSPSGPAIVQPDPLARLDLPAIDDALDPPECEVRIPIHGLDLRLAQGPETVRSGDRNVLIEAQGRSTGIGQARQVRAGRTILQGVEFGGGLREQAAGKEQYW
jgi:hypothetical protein